MIMAKFNNTDVTGNTTTDMSILSKPLGFALTHFLQTGLAMVN